MTEEEARTKWCPFASVPLSANGGSGTRPAGQSHDCIGSDCMAWRWATIPNPEWRPANMMSTFPGPNPYSAAPAGTNSATHGRCGLAGQENP